MASARARRSGGKIIGDQRVGRRHPAGLPYPDAEAKQEQLAESLALRRTEP